MVERQEEEEQGGGHSHHLVGDQKKMGLSKVVFCQVDYKKKELELGLSSNINLQEIMNMKLVKML